MPRIKIDIPANLLMSVNIAVRITDINYGNHLGNDALVGILHEARAKWLELFNYTELNIEGVGLIMSDLAVEFKSEAFYGEILEISLASGEISRISFELFYEVKTLREERKLLIAKAKTGMVCYDYGNKQTVAVPERLRSILQNRL